MNLGGGDAVRIKRRRVCACQRRRGGLLRTGFELTRACAFAGAPAARARARIVDRPGAELKKKDATDEHSPATKRRILSVAFVTMFLDLLGFGLIIPIQPFYAEGFGASPTVVTLLGAAYSLMQFIFVPFWGRLSDRIGRRPVILSSVILGGIGHLLFGLAGSLPMLFGARLLAGFGNANIATVQALIADSTTGAERTRGMGMIGAAFGLGFIVGPAVGGVLVRWGLEAPAYAAAALALVNFGMAFFMLPETNTYRQNRGEARRKSLSPRQIFALARTLPNVFVITALMLIWTTGFALFEQSLSLYIEHVWVQIPPELMLEAQRAGAEAVAALRSEYLRKAAGHAAMVLVSIGASAAIVQGLLIGRLSARFGERRLVRFGLPILAFGMLAILAVGRVGYFPAIFPFAMLLAVGTGFTSPSLMSLLSQASPPNVQGSLLGIGQSAGSLGRVIGPSLSGFLFERNVELPAIVGASVLLVGFLVSFLLRATVADEPVDVDALTGAGG